MSIERFEITTEGQSAEDGELAVVRVTGEIDIANAEQLSTALRSPQCADAVGVALDLSRVSFMDSSGLAALLTATRELEGRLVVVIDENSAVARLFEIAEVEGHVRTASSEAEALAALAGAADDPGG